MDEVIDYVDLRNAGMNERPCRRPKVFKVGLDSRVRCGNQMIERRLDEWLIGVDIIAVGRCGGDRRRRSNE